MSRATAERQHCMDCGITMNDEEREFYEYRCEGCERKFHERLQRWKAGEKDGELERIFGRQHVH